MRAVEVAELSELRAGEAVLQPLVVELFDGGTESLGEVAEAHRTSLLRADGVARARMSSSSASSTAPNNCWTSPSGDTTTSAGCDGTPKRANTSPGSSLTCGNVSPCLSMKP